MVAKKLKTYAAKRDFSITSEPKGATAARKTVAKKTATKKTTTKKTATKKTTAKKTASAKPVAKKTVATKAKANNNITTKNNLFVVQRHDASHLHYDLRLEVNGVLKSWAVPKGIPKEYNQKRLAIQTEDHPLEYANFEGVIPKGQYGGGTVKIWDKGEYEQLDKEYHPRATVNSALKAGAIKFQLKGKRYKGCYAMARFKRENNKDQWLLFRVTKEK